MVNTWGIWRLLPHCPPLGLPLRDVAIGTVRRARALYQSELDTSIESAQHLQRALPTCFRVFHGAPPSSDVLIWPPSVARGSSKASGNGKFSKPYCIQKSTLPV